MIFCLTLKSDKILNKAPNINSIVLSIDGKKETCCWGEINARIGGLYITYRMKDIMIVSESKDKERIKDLFTKENVAIEEVLWSGSRASAAPKIKVINFEIRREDTVHFA